MSLRNENIGIAVGLLIYLVGQVMTGWDPGQRAGALIGTAVLAAAFGISFYLNEQDQNRGLQDKRLRR